VFDSHNAPQFLFRSRLCSNDIAAIVGRIEVPAGVATDSAAWI